MKKSLFALALAMLSLPVLADTCPPSDYAGKIEDLVEIRVERLEYLNAGKEGGADSTVYVFPKDKLGDLDFYGGAVQIGQPVQLHSVLNFFSANDRPVAWFMANSKQFDRVRIIAWYNNAACHSSASFLLSEHVKAAKPGKRPAKP
jgi:hypothetical protein